MPFSLPMTIDDLDVVIDFSSSGEQLIDMSVGSNVEIVQGDHYEGSYVVTPSAEEQILQTAELYCTDNIKVNPIPSNWGLITYDGSIITVS